MLEGTNSSWQELLLLQRVECAMVTVGGCGILHTVLSLHVLLVCCLVLPPVLLSHQVTLLQVSTQRTRHATASTCQTFTHAASSACTGSIAASLIVAVGFRAAAEEP